MSSRVNPSQMHAAAVARAHTHVEVRSNVREDLGARRGVRDLRHRKHRRTHARRASASDPGRRARVGALVRSLRR